MFVAEQGARQLLHDFLAPRGARGEGSCCAYIEIRAERYVISSCPSCWLVSGARDFPLIGQ